MKEISFRVLMEKVKAEMEIRQIKLPVSIAQLAPVFSKQTMDLHYGTLYKNYIKKALDGDGDFQVAGAKLHTLFFEQFQKPTTPNVPTGEIKNLIDDKFGSYQEFKDEMTNNALEIHGSGWVYLSKNGSIKIIHNHKIVDDVLILIDMWEHSYQSTYGADKEKYLKSIWSIINFNIINERLN